MKDYKRLTEKSVSCFKYCLKNHKSKNDEFNNYDAFFDYSMAVKRLGELEDKIEREELIDINELMTAETTRDLTDKEIEFFIKHNEKVRKVTAREILEPLREAVMKHSDCCVNLSEDIKFLWRKYGLELEDKE